MPDQFYPTVDIDFLVDQILLTPKVIANSKLKVGSTTSFVLKGNQSISKRLISIRENSNGQVGYIQATGLAVRFNFMGSLLKWLLANRNWREGAYILPKEAQQPNGL